jgi:hypothetical protein
MSYFISWGIGIASPRIVDRAADAGLGGGGTGLHLALQVDACWTNRLLADARRNAHLVRASRVRRTVGGRAIERAPAAIADGTAVSPATRNLTGLRHAGRVAHAKASFANLIRPTGAAVESAAAAVANRATVFAAIEGAGSLLDTVRPAHTRALLAEPSRLCAAPTAECAAASIGELSSAILPPGGIASHRHAIGNHALVVYARTRSGVTRAIDLPATIVADGSAEIAPRVGTGLRNAGVGRMVAGAGIGQDDDGGVSARASAARIACPAAMPCLWRVGIGRDDAAAATTGKQECR